MEEPDSANSSFYSTQSAPASQVGPRATSSTHSLARLSSPNDGNSALLSLPGYRPTTRSSARRSQAGVSSGAPPGRGLFPNPTQIIRLEADPGTGKGQAFEKPNASFPAAFLQPQGLACPARGNQKCSYNGRAISSTLLKFRGCQESFMPFSGGKGLPKGQAGQCFTLRFFLEALVLWGPLRYQFLALE